MADSTELSPGVNRPAFLFAPGAGAAISHCWMQHWAALLGEVGPVHPFDYPYMKEGGRRPDPLPKLIVAHREALAAIRESGASSIVLIGKSMGSRVGCHVSLEELVSAVVCFGYPLCGGGDPTKMRDAVLRKLRTPILFIQGTRDTLCPLPLLETVRSEMIVENQLHVVPEGDHSLLVTKKWLKEHEQTQDDVDHGILAVIRSFVSSRTM